MQSSVILIMFGICVKYPKSCNWVLSAKLSCCIACFRIMFSHSLCMDVFADAHGGNACVHVLMLKGVHSCMCIPVN